MADLAKNKGKQEMEMQKKRRIFVTFDIDGTLLKAVGKPTEQRQRQAYSHAIKQVFGIEDADIEVIPHHGQTDPFILVNTPVHYGIPYDVALKSLSELKENMLEYCEWYSDELEGGYGPKIEVLPGVTSLLNYLLNNNVTIGLATGDYKDLAWRKLESLRFDRYFWEPDVGGYGDDHMERGDLVIIAADRAKELYNYEEDFDLRVHVGDTPHDIRAAESGGALAVGVCTGVFTADDLRAASNGNAVILPDLNDYQAFMKALGIYVDNKDI